MLDEIDMHCVSPLWWNQRLECLVRLLGGLARAKQPNALCDTPNMGINRKSWFAE
jgi:hypothetical protein